MAIEILKALQVKQARDGEFSDGGGLLLRVKRDAASFVFRFTAPLSAHCHGWEDRPQLAELGRFTTKGVERTTRELRPACLPTSCDICNYVRMFATILRTY